MAVARLQTAAATHESPGDDALFELIKERSFRRGHFVLSSGLTSDHYFDLKPTMMSPKGAELSAKAFLDRALASGAEYIGGLEMGAVPIIGAVAALSSVENRPLQTFFVRKAPKGHGTKKLIEGLTDEETLAGKRVLVVDDVATKGGSLMQAIEAVREQGGLVDSALVLLDREEGAEAFLRGHGVGLISIFRASRFL